MLSPFLIGGDLIMLGCGLSVARARAAKVSMIKLIQRRWMVPKGDSPRMMMPVNTTARVVILTETWN